MKNYKDYYLEAVSTLEDLKEKLEKNTDEGLSFYLLQLSAERFLKSLLSYYGISFPELEYIDTLIESLEEKTTIRLSEFKEELYELSFVPYEGGCASSTVYEKRPDSFISTIEKLKRFVEEELPVF